MLFVYWKPGNERLIRIFDHERTKIVLENPENVEKEFLNILNCII